MVSAMNQCEWAIGIHLSPPSWTSLLPLSPFHPSRLSQSAGFGFPVSYSKFPLAIYFAYGIAYVSMLLSQIIPPCPSPLCPKVCSLSRSLLCCPASRIISTVFLDSISSVQSLRCVWLFVTLWTAVHQASLSITNSWSLLKLISIELVMPSNHLILCHPLLLPPSIFSSIRVFSNESALHIRWPKYWSFIFNISPSNEY